MWKYGTRLCSQDTILYSGYNFVLWIQRSVLKWQWKPSVTTKTKGLLTAKAMQVSGWRTQINHAIQTHRSGTSLVFRSHPRQVRTLCLLSFCFLIALCCCSSCRPVTSVLKAGSWNTEWLKLSMGNEDIINCISEQDVLAVVDMRQNKMEDREASQREVKDGQYVLKSSRGGGFTNML
jgi:hypothetical protein